jgi:hypothetical protein
MFLKSYVVKLWKKIKKVFHIFVVWDFILVSILVETNRCGQASIKIKNLLVQTKPNDDESDRSLSMGFFIILWQDQKNTTLSILHMMFK